MVKAMNDDFFDTLPVFVHFEGVADTGNYKPLPDDWVLATADIVGSTKAIKAGRYKAVNMAGASVISAILNALGKRNYPFVFGGDGALVALPGFRCGSGARSACRSPGLGCRRSATEPACSACADARYQGTGA